MNYILDIGNTQIKLGIFEHTQMIHVQENLSNAEVIKLIDQQKPQYLALTSVKKLEETFLTQLKQISNVFILNADTPLPIQNLYQTPQTLGSDRIAAVVGASIVYPAKASLVIDAGTCITYDFIDREKKYHGGNISPGLQMRFKAMNYFTSKLPLVENCCHEVTSLVGKTTKEAMQNGVLAGYTIDSLKGDRFFFETRIKERIFVASNLILTGLNEILRYNIEKK